MRNFNKIDDFFAFITEAGDAVLTLCADPWFTSPDGSIASFLDFFCRQKDNMIRIAAAGDAVSDDEFCENSTPSELSSKVTEVLSHRIIRDFFGLSAPAAVIRESAVSLMQSSPAARVCAEAV